MLEPEFWSSNYDSKTDWILALGNLFNNSICVIIYKIYNVILPVYNSNFRKLQKSNELVNRRL